MTTIDNYIATVPEGSRAILQKIRETIRQAVPEAQEAISYGMPAFTLHGKTLVYFAAWQHHIGFYATPAGNEAFRKELSPYQSAKGSVKFPLDQPMPYKLIAQIATFRAHEIARQ
ncbi:MAG TPA: DUF1801 domain-containing protein [Bacillota bacterium]|nr:DUF1801 domain-containing protein [Bacillota bacterium]